MGFYGNITNSAKTNMTFDKKYSSRYEMDKNVESDGVYAGRYVLVEYGLSWSSAVYSSDKDDNNSDENILYYKWGNNLYKDSAYTQKIILNPEEIEIFFVVEYKTDSVKRSRSELWVNYKTGRLEQVIDKISDDSADSNYVANFNIDKKIYGDGRGYDSTVWTKVFDKNGKPQYVMIAELNSVVPTFSLTVDAPSDKPNAPYFDELGSNVHYNMHIRNPWGYKVGTIEFNEAGFDSKNRVIVENPQDYITITDDFSNPKNSYNGKEEKDVKKLSINLPSIGNMVAKGWDVIHGEDREDDPATSLQGRLNFFTNKDGKGIKENEIPVQSNEGYLVGATFKEENLNDSDNRLWIESTIDSTTKKITVKHTFKEGTSTNTFANKNIGSVLEEGQESGINHTADNILKLYTPLVDKMGHVVAKNIETVTLPYGFKTFTIGADSNKTDGITSNTASIVADNIQDSLTIDPGNKWIHLAGNESEDKIIIAHAISEQTSITVGNETASPVFGGTFNIARFATDNAGHIIEAKNQEITLPKGSYAAADEVTESPEVITSIEFNVPSGKISSTKADSSTLKLASYSAGTDVTDVTVGDTYNNAFAKLQNQIHAEESARIEAIKNLDVPEIKTENYEIFSTISEVNGKIAVSTKNAGTLTLEGYKKPTEDSISTDDSISKDDSLNQALGKLEYKLDTEIDRVDNLNYSDIESTTTKVITKVTQDNGKVNVIHTNVGNLLRVTGYDDNNNEITTTIDDSFANLQTQIDNIIGNEEIAENFDTIKEIADWLKANDSEADGIIDSIAILNGNEETSGSVQNQIKTAIENLDSEKVASAGKYISGIHIVDGKISTIDEIELPTYVSNVQADWNATEGAATILNKPINLITTDSEFLYSSNEITDETTGNVEVVEVKYTIEELMAKIFELENRIKDLEALQEESTT